jgi:Tol biopolymer transport system component
MRNRRKLLIAIVVVVTMVGAGVFLLADRIRNAPLVLGDTTQQTGVEIPFGAPGHDLALMTNSAGNWDIAMLAADGTLTNLTSASDTAASQDGFPSWAMDAGQINFLSNRLSPDGLGPSQMNPDGSDLRNLDIVSAIFSVASSGRLDWDPAWSPDGTRLLWSSLRDTNLELYMIDLDKEFIISNATRLTDSAARDWFGAWSPDGKSVARSSDVAGNEDIYIIDVATGDSVAITDNEWDDFRVSWALDGTTLLYISDENDDLHTGNLNFHLMSPQGEDKHALGETIFVGGGAWSPDGTQVAYFSNESGRWQVYVMNTDGTNKRRVTPDDGDYLYPVWKP